MLPRFSLAPRKVSATHLSKTSEREEDYRVPPWSSIATFVCVIKEAIVHSYSKYSCKHSKKPCRGRRKDSVINYLANLGFSTLHPTTYCIHSTHLIPAPLLRDVYIHRLRTNTGSTVQSNPTHVDNPEWHLSHSPNHRT